jgi:ornithine carbamoyltransferase
VVQISPEGYQIDPTLLAEMKNGAVGELSVTSSLKDGLQDADVIYTDCWPARRSESEQQHIRQLFIPYQITLENLAWAAPEALFLPCPPVHRSEEVSDSVMRSPVCCVYEAKEYLLHAQNAYHLKKMGDSAGKVERVLVLRCSYFSYFVQGQTASEDRPNNLVMEG